jgi:hypothetical protein
MVVTGADAGDSHRFPTTRDQLEQLTQWLQARGIEEVVMESTSILEAGVAGAGAELPAASGAGPRKSRAARPQARLRRRPPPAAPLRRRRPEQRAWRIATRMRQQLVRDRVRLQAQIEVLLEEAAIKLSADASSRCTNNCSRFIGSV